jgi:galactokinase
VIHNLEKNIDTVYGNNPSILDRQRKRIDSLCNDFCSRYGNNYRRILSSPGRSEISGNHTDHNNGRVIAASINLDTIGAAAQNNTGKAILYSHEYQKEFVVDVVDLDKREEERGTTAALIRGILRGFKEKGYSIGGFSGYVRSDVRVGSGLSSSASIEVFIGTILNVLFNYGQIEPLEVAKIAQFAENEYFGKPCGLMDQIACVFGGIVSIDFADQKNPIIEKIDLDLNTYGYGLLFVDTGSDHADLTSEYASIPTEMRMVADAMGKRNCREITKQQLYRDIPDLRTKVHERPILRALHFLEENDRVEKQTELLKRGKFPEFLSLVNESGNSSMKLLQNIYPVHNARHQPLTLGLVLTERYLSSIGEGAVRIHGGGFAGMFQVFLPERYIPSYIDLIEPLFGRNSVKNLAIRHHGAVVLS